MKSVDKPARKARGYARVRTFTVLVAFLAVVVGLFVPGGWGTLSSFGYDAVATLCPLGALETLIAERAMVPRAVVVFVVTIVLVALLGRVFCAWVCPVPPIQRFFRPKERTGRDVAAGGQVPQGSAADGQAPQGAAADAPARGLSEDEAADIRAQADALVAQTCGGSCKTCALPPVGGKRDALRLDSRHGVLLGSLASTALFGFPVFCLVCPIGLTFALVIGVYRAVFQQSPTVSLLVFALILLAELVFFRKWCHALCPMGALMSLVGAKAPLAKPTVDASACLRSKGVDCKTCVRVCPEQLDPHSTSLAECTKCGICIDECPAHAISFRTALRAGAAEGASLRSSSSPDHSKP